jgi:hypothetical protein
MAELKVQRSQLHLYKAKGPFHSYLDADVPD